jgi:hypothetical protein
MSITARKLQSAATLFTALALFSQTGCTAGISSVRYDSSIGDRNLIPARANITVNITGSNIHWRFREAAAKTSITNSIKRDLEQNIFYAGENSLLNVNVNVERLGYREEQWYWLSWMVYPFYLFGMPLAKAIGSVDVSLEIFSLDNELLASYRSTQAIQKWYNIYSVRSIFPSTINQGGITRDALQFAMEDLKYQFINDRRAVALVNDHINRTTPNEPELDSYPYTSYSQMEDQQEKLNVAVIDLDAISLSVAEATTLTNRLRVELFRTGRFVVFRTGPDAGNPR